MLKNFWYAICLSKELESKPIGITALGSDLVIYRNSNNEPIVMSNLCVHRGASLSSGWVKQDCIVCPYHGWEYKSDGSCIKIPSYKENVPIPNKARVLTYPTQEKYGLIWAFIGDISESERPPIPIFSEYDDPKYKKLWGDYSWDVNYTRAVENGIDIAHAPFVHAGSFGNPEESEVENYQVEKSDWGGDATVNLNPTPPRGLWSIFSRGKARPPIKTTTGYWMPNITRLQVRLPIGEFILYVCHLPIDNYHTRSIWLQLRSFFTNSVFDRDSYQRVIKIFEEDRQTVMELKPQILPYDLGTELHVRSDAIQIHFRKECNRYAHKVWTIESK
ncbi:ring-hydroxylating dioxygenase, large terminal subunit [Synechococcus sp. PCC 7502]|uniref:aromatic ring-hydroxylating dioxygenase subunit alpha n=1 Tax=Synechococcus sp. PCC 7502 TaxID=1173263 RepID=UPI00029FB86A|nr:aromatic ring-hydroxylating dioxygenase subunit alpha [Synechococcus sp. PCC 7502]AFY75079.1 ring-hydroxylating dioxygenase, large terminal subunit [Synechococcus sp. PCC 7502]